MTIEKAGMIINLPGKIRDGTCTHCQADVSYAVEAYMAGQIDRPKYCPNCNVKLIDGDSITKLVWTCKNCGEEVADPQKQKFCTGCKTEIIFPQEEDPRIIKD